MKKGKVLITNYVHDYLIDNLVNQGYEICYDQNFDPQTLDDQIHVFTGIIINSKIIMTAERLNMASKLKFIGRLGSGLEIIDLPTAEKLGIAVFNSPEGNRNAVAEHALGMLLAFSNNLLRCDREVRAFKWYREKNRGFEIEGKTIGIIGLGNTGEAFARKLSGWAQTVLYYDKYRLDSCSELTYLDRVTLKELQERSDIISIHLPLTIETKWMIDESFFQNCKDNLVLVNTSRGSIVKTKDLISAIKSKQLKGACLDVFENEKPFSFSSEENQLYTELYEMENVILSPHVAGWTDESLLKIAETLANKVRQIV